MKSLTKFIGAAILAAAITVNAQNFQSRNFIGGGGGQATGTPDVGYLQVAAISTNFFNGTNIYVKSWSVTNSTTYPYVSGYSPLFTTNTSAIADVTSWGNRDGTPAIGNISVRINGQNAGFVSVGLFKFAVVPNGSVAATEPQNQFQFAVTGNGTNDVVLATNVPLTFLQGSHRVRLVSIEWTGGGGGRGQVVGAWLNGYAPDGAE